MTHGNAERGGRPTPTHAFHFTSVANLPGIIANGLLSDRLSRSHDLTKVTIGAAPIKARRLLVPVPIAPGGHVGDYVPLYFAPRSPMMYTLRRGNHDHDGDLDDVIYLCTTLETVLSAGLACVVSDRNAAQAVATFCDGRAPLDSHVDWPLMRQGSWGRTDADPDRPDRRMAELLVHQRLPFDAVGLIVAQNGRTADAARAHLGDAGRSTRVDVRPGWYF